MRKCNKSSSQLRGCKARMSKMGQTPFELKEFTSELGKNVILSASSLNALRREASEMLKKERSKIREKAIFPYHREQIKPKDKKHKKILVISKVRTEEQMLNSENADIILLPLSLAKTVKPDLKYALSLDIVCADCENLKKEIKALGFKKGFAHSLGEAELLKECGMEVFYDWGMNIYNSVALNLLRHSEGVCLSPELSLDEIRLINDKTNVPTFVNAYGYQAVMTARACLIRGIRGKCNCKAPVSLKDKTGATFKIYGDEKTHFNTVCNSRPTFMADKLKELSKSGIKGMILSFTEESGEETKNIIEMYKGNIPPEKPLHFTRGYFMKK